MQVEKRHFRRSKKILIFINNQIFVLTIQRGVGDGWARWTIAIQGLECQLTLSQPERTDCAPHITSYPVNIIQKTSCKKAVQTLKQYVAVLFYYHYHLWATVLEAVLAFMYTRLQELGRGGGAIVSSYFGRNKSKNFPFQKDLDYQILAPQDLQTFLRPFHIQRILYVVSETFVLLFLRLLVKDTTRLMVKAQIRS